MKGSSLTVRVNYASILKTTRLVGLQIVGFTGEKGILNKRCDFSGGPDPRRYQEGQGEKKLSYDGSEVSSDSLEPTPLIHSEGEGHVQVNAVGDETPAEDINHVDVREQSPLVAPAATLVL